MTNSEKVLTKVFDSIEYGTIKLITYEQKEYLFGQGNKGPSCTIKILNEKFFAFILSRGRIGLGESYTKGWWKVENAELSDFLGILLRNNLEEKTSLGWSISLQLLFKNEFHYDLSNEFFQLFLDESMSYTCGYMINSEDSIDQMQFQKHALISKKMNISDKKGKLLDIGCGWGGLLKHIGDHNKNINCVGVTLSKEQHSYANELMSLNNLDDRISIQLMDYRDIQGKFDFIVSVGMFEHVGKENYKTFMKKTKELLSPGGIGLLHTMGMSGRKNIDVDAWLKKYIFPGTAVPYLSEISDHMRLEDLKIIHVENIGPHYVDTLKHWINKFNNNIDDILNLEGMDMEFIRTWEYYLNLGRAGFQYGNMQLFQCLFCHEVDRSFFNPHPPLP